jgi:hypothetical protein
MFAIVKIGVVYGLGRDKQLIPITNKDMYTVNSGPIHRTVLVLYYRCHLRDKIM